MSLPLRLTVAMVALVVLTAAAVQYLSYRGLVAAILPAELGRLDASAHRSFGALDDNVSNARRATLGFRKAVALDGLVRASRAGGTDPATGMSVAQWREGLLRRLAAEVESHAEYHRFSLVGIADSGREVLGVSRDPASGEVRAARGDELRRHAGRPHFAAALARPPGSVHVSPPELSRHGGAIEVPHVPVVQVATPVFDEQGRPFGFLNLTLSLATLFAELPRSVVRPGTTYVVNARGDFLLHPDSTRAFGFELGRRHRWQDEFPEMAGALEGDGRPPRVLRDRHGREWGIAVARGRLAGGPEIALIDVVPRATLLAPTQAVRRASLLAGALAAALAAVLAFLLARTITRPIAQMTRAVRRLGSDRPLGLDPGSAGEMNALASAMETMQDELREKTRELRESEGRLKLALATSHTGVWEWNFRGGPHYWSEECSRILGGLRALPDLESLAAMLHPEDAPRIRAAAERALRQRADFREEFRLRLADGQTRWVANLARAQYDQAGAPVRVVGTIRDITERRQAEAALRDSEDRFRELAESIDEVFWMTDPGKSAMLYVSPGYERIWGRPCESLYRNPMSWLETIHPDDRIGVAEAVRVRQPAGTYDETYRIVRPDGEVRWIHDRAYLIRDEAGAVRRVVGVAEDVTRQRELESQVRQAQKMDSIGQLAGGVAHDFNNILTVILGHVSLMRAAASGPPDESLEQVALAAERAAALTGQLLAFSRRQPLQPRVVDLGEVIRHMTRLLGRLLGEDIRLDVDVADDVPPVFADPSMLEQVLMNLAVNARDAMPRGGRLAIRARFEPMDPRDSRRHADAPHGPLVCLTVADTGTGMSPETLAHAFEPFFTTKDVGRGTGLGLATVYGIVRQHHGWIGVESEAGRGTEFRVWLPPASPAHALPDHPPVAGGVTRGGHETVLLVEDDGAVRELVRGMLERHGYRVIAAQSGVDALRLWREQGDDIQLLVTDIVMPDGVNGRELLDRLRADRPGLPAICMSGYAADVIGEGTGLGSDVPCLRKPFAPRELLDSARALLDGASRG